MVTVALIGPDGAGKTTLARALAEHPGARIKYLYMGVNSEASNHVLPTTRALRALKRALGRPPSQGGPPDPARARRSGKGVKRLLAELKSSLVLANRVAEEGYRALLARWYEWRGYVVLFDRHFYADYWAHDVRAQASPASEPRSLARRLHGRFLARLPRPDWTILLDAPAEVLFRRKPEGTLELLERRRAEYLRLRAELGTCSVVDASAPQPEVKAAVQGIIDGLRAGAVRPGGPR